MSFTRVFHDHSWLCYNISHSLYRLYRDTVVIMGKKYCDSFISPVTQKFPPLQSKWELDSSAWEISTNKKELPKLLHLIIKIGGPNSLTWDLLVSRGKAEGCVLSGAMTHFSPLLSSRGQANSCCNSKLRAVIMKFLHYKDTERGEKSMRAIQRVKRVEYENQALYPWPVREDSLVAKILWWSEVARQYIFARKRCITSDVLVYLFFSSLFCIWVEQAKRKSSV